MSDTNDQRPPVPEDLPGFEERDCRPQAAASTPSQVTDGAGEPDAPASQELPVYDPWPHAPRHGAATPGANSQAGAETTPMTAQPMSWYEAAHQREAARAEGAGTYATRGEGSGADSSDDGLFVTPETPDQNLGAATRAYARPTERVARPSSDAGNGGNGGDVNGGSGATSPSGKAPKHHGKGKMFLLALLGGAIGACAVVAVLLGTGVVATGKGSIVSTSQQVTIDPSDEDTTLANAVAAKALPSVVSINVTTSDGAGVGSGVVLDSEGHILTNYHVIDDAQSISVSVNGNSYDAQVIGSDESSDLAVVKIDPGSDTLTPIEVGDSSSLQVGDWVMSIGSPFGLEQSVSTGIVSSLYRSTMLQGSSGNTIYTNLIQTDAAINPGNSGGALVDNQGKLVGINSIIESASGSSSGVGFAIPGNYAVEVAQKLINGETVTHAYLGGSFQTVTAANARRNNLAVNQGAYVAEVTSGSPADEAGIKQGDIITAIDNEEITSSDGVVLAVRSHNVGDTVTVQLVRGSESMSVQLTLGSDEELQKQQSMSESEDTSTNSLLEEYLNQFGLGNGSGNSGSGNSGSSNGSGSGSGNGLSGNGRGGLSGGSTL